MPRSSALEALLLSSDTFRLAFLLLIVALTVTLQIPVLFGAHLVLIRQAPAELGPSLSYSGNGHGFSYRLISETS
jgi:hypothetical protein